MIYKLILSFFLILSLSGSVSAFLISDQGNSVRNLTGSLLENGNLTIAIYDDSTTGNLIFSSTAQGAIVNGSWNLMINPSLEYGKRYWKDYEINGEDLDFDGNERLEFQSSVGLINNLSFINFSLINSCPTGSSIRSIYLNGSVDCETDDSSNGTSSDLTNYALKNQSENFSGNITTTYTGFFGFLGSLTSRITKLFVNDVDASGNVNVTGNVTANYFKGDGSLLTNLPAGSEADPIFVTENTTLWGAINSKLSQNDQRYNDTSLIIGVNRTTNIMSLGFYNRTEVDGLISGGNSSFNQTFTNTLYYSISNPSNFINNSGLSIYNDTTIILTTNSSLWSYINSNFGSWNSTFNLTYNSLLGQQCPTGYLVNGTLLNGTLTCMSSTLSESDPLWTANATSVLYVSNLPLENKTISHISNITGFSFNYNQTTPAVSYVNSQGYLTSLGANASYLAIADLPLTNRTIVHCSNITGATSNLCTITNNDLVNVFNQVLNTTSNATFASVNATGEVYVANIAVGQWLYNQTNPAIADVNNRFWNKTYSYNKTEIDSNNASWTSTYNSTYASNLANNSWNETRANGLYSGVEWAYNQTTPAVSYVNSVNSTIVSWVDGVFAKLVNVFNRTEIQNQYYNKTEIVSFGYVNSSGLQSYNLTEMILSVNTTTNIMSLSFYNRSEINSLINNSFNQSLTNSLYYSINNTLNFINHTQTGVYNDTLLILSVNRTTNIMSLGFYNSTQIDSLIDSSANSSFNQSFTDNLYYSALNPLGFINHTLASVYNDTAIVLNVNSTIWSYINSNFGSWSFTFNSTYNSLLGQQCPVGSVVNGTLLNGTLSCVIDSTGSVNVFNQVLNATSNVTFANLTVSNDVVINGIRVSTWLYNQSDGGFNSTYAQFAYNQTTSANAYADSIMNRTFNQSLTDLLYASITWGYNQTAPVINDINLRFWNRTQSYNKTEIDGFNASWSSTYNTTYAGLINNASYLLTYNGTYANILNQQCSAGLVVNGTLANGTFTCVTPPAGSESDPLWGANLTSGVSNDLNPLTDIIQSLGSSAKRWLKGWFKDLDISNNVSVSGNVSAQFYLGSLNRSTFPTSACSGTDKVVSISSDGTVNCASDETGGASSLTTKTQRVDVITTSGTLWNFTNLGFMVSSSKNYTLICNILYTGAAATVGQAINISTTATTTDVTIAYDTWSSATAKVGFSATSFGTALTGTGSGAGVIKPNLIIADFRTTGAGAVNLSIRSEVDTSATTLKRGSLCNLYDITNSA